MTLLRSTRTTAGYIQPNLCVTHPTSHSDLATRALQLSFWNVGAYSVCITVLCHLIGFYDGLMIFLDPDLFALVWRHLFDGDYKECLDKGVWIRASAKCRESKCKCKWSFVFSLGTKHKRQPSCLVRNRSFLLSRPARSILMPTFPSAWWTWSYSNILEKGFVEVWAKMSQNSRILY